MDGINEHVCNTIYSKLLLDINIGISQLYKILHHFPEQFLFKQQGCCRPLTSDQVLNTLCNFDLYDSLLGFELRHPPSTVAPDPLQLSRL